MTVGGSAGGGGEAVGAAGLKGWAGLCGGGVGLLSGGGCPDMTIHLRSIDKMPRQI